MIQVDQSLSWKRRDRIRSKSLRSTLRSENLFKHRLHAKSPLFPPHSLHQDDHLPDSLTFRLRVLLDLPLHSLCLNHHPLDQSSKLSLALLPRNALLRSLQIFLPPIHLVLFLLDPILDRIPFPLLPLPLPLFSLQADLSLNYRCALELSRHLHHLLPSPSLRRSSQTPRRRNLPLSLIDHNLLRLPHYLLKRQYQRELRLDQGCRKACSSRNRRKGDN